MKNSNLVIALALIYALLGFVVGKNSTTQAAKQNTAKKPLRDLSVVAQAIPLRLFLRLNNYEMTHRAPYLNPIQKPAKKPRRTYQPKPSGPLLPLMRFGPYKRIPRENGYVQTNFIWRMKDSNSTKKKED